MHRSILACGVVAAALFMGASFAPQASAQWNNVEQPDSYGAGDIGNGASWSGGWNFWLTNVSVGFVGATGAQGDSGVSGHVWYNGHVKNVWTGSPPADARYVRVTVSGGMGGYVWALTSGTGGAGGSSQADGEAAGSYVGSAGNDVTVGIGISHSVPNDQTTKSGNVGGMGGYADATWTVVYTEAAQSIVLNGRPDAEAIATYSADISTPLTYETSSPTSDPDVYWTDRNEATVSGYVFAGDNGTGSSFVDAASSVAGTIEWWY